MECAASTDDPSQPVTATADTAFDPAGPNALDPSVTLRPERFAALASPYGNRRLTFLRSPDLVTAFRDLEHHDSVDGALAGSEFDPARWPASRKGAGVAGTGGGASWALTRLARHAQ